MNDLAPSVSVSVAEGSSGQLVYSYIIGNGRSAKDAIGDWSLVVPAANLDLESTRAAGPGNNPVWMGAAAHVAIAKQAVFPDAPLGRYLLWFHPDENYVRPGETLGSFVLKSSYRPGLTTAWFGPGKLVEFDQSWPREIFEKLELLEDRRWRKRYTITAGPMFAPDTPATLMAETLRSNVDDMQKAGLVDSSSPFAQEVLRVLSKMSQANGGLNHLALHERPNTDAERTIATALRVSLGVVKEH